MEFVPLTPNPFNAGTNITFDLPYASRVTITAYDMLGRRMDLLVDAAYERGRRSIRWNPTIASGVYIVRISAVSQEGQGENFSASCNVVLLR